MAITRVTPLATVVEADQHFADRVVTWAWDEANSIQQSKALAEATRILNNLRWRGEKTSATQANAWPRDNVPTVTDGTTPEDIKRGCIELAYSLLSGDYSDERYEDTRVKRESINGAGIVSYDTKALPPFLAAGVPSMACWACIAKYLGQTKSVRLVRAS